MKTYRKIVAGLTIISSLFLYNPPVVHAGLTSAPVSCWALNESSGNATDGIGSNTLTNNNTVTYEAAKMNNGAKMIAASTQSLSIADASQSGLDITGNQSMAMWIKISSAPSNGSYTMMAKYNSLNPAVGWTWDYNDLVGTKRFRAVMGNGVGQTSTTVNADLGTGTFHHVVYVYTAAAGTIDTYLDGANAGQMTGQITSLANTPNTFAIGQISPDNGNYMDGVIDGAGIWNVALTSGDVTWLYNAGVGSECPYTSPFSAGGGYRRRIIEE